MFAEAMSGAERTRQWRERKRREAGIRRWQNQEHKWLQHVREERRRMIAATLTKHPAAVKEYLTMATDYRALLKLAIAAAESGKFAPESINIIRTRHEELTLLMDALEKTVGERRHHEPDS